MGGRGGGVGVGDGVEVGDEIGLGGVWFEGDEAAVRTGTGCTSGWIIAL